MADSAPAITDEYAGDKRRLGLFLHGDHPRIVLVQPATAQFIFPSWFNAHEEDLELFAIRFHLPELAQAKILPKVGT